MLTHARTGLQRLVQHSPWYRFAVVATLVTAGLDGWLSPAIIAASPATGELNPISLYHGAGPVGFAVGRVVAAAVVLAVLGMVAARSDPTELGEACPWLPRPLSRLRVADICLGWAFVLNAGNGIVAAASALAALATGVVSAGHFLGPSALAVVLAALCCGATAIDTDSRRNAVRARSLRNP